MSYLLDKKTKEKKFFRTTLWVVLFVILFYFRTSIWNSFSYVTGGIFRPVLVLGNSLGNKFKNLGAYFNFKNSLSAENENLKSQILESEADRANYTAVVAENISLKEMLGRKNEKTPMILSAILAKPNQSPYDTIVIDVGVKQGIEIGAKVFAWGDIPIGRVETVNENSSKVVLFSNPGEKTQAVLPKDIFLELIGRGGGNFEMILPRDLVLQKGEQVTLPGIHPYTLAVVETIISDPRDPFTKALLRSPVNIQNLKFVEVESQ